MRFSARLLLLLFTASWLPAQSTSARRTAPPKTSIKAYDLAPATLPAPGSGTLFYDIEWRLIHAGTAKIESDKSRFILTLESAGLVSALYKVHDVYTAAYDDRACAASTLMDSEESKRHHETEVTFDKGAGRASYIEKDLDRNVVLHSAQTDIPACVEDVVGGLLKLRTMNILPGQSAQMPVSDGRRFAMVKVEAQAREALKTAHGDYSTIRYEAYLLNGIVYHRKGSVQVWVTDDTQRLPVQIRLRTTFPVGTVTLELVKEEHR